jgi:tRNA(fMet)-specific endonuclease VapC
MICLDTNAVIVAINKPTSSVRERFDRTVLDGTPIGISAIVLSELCYGIAKSKLRKLNTQTLANFLDGPVQIQILPFDAEDAREAGDIRAALERAGTPIGAYDILIAAQARRRGATLVTANAREFARVPGLRTEDWAG